MSKQSAVAYDYTDKEVSAAYFNLPRLYSGVSITLENPILPAEILSNPPSLADGMDYETERAIRFCGCDLIQRASILLRLPQVAAATGQIIFHRFFYARSFLRCTFDYVCMACIYLASKIEESPRRIRDVINVFHQLKQRPARSVRRGCQACPIVRTIRMYISNAVCPHDVIGCTFNLCDHTYTRLIEVSRWHFDSDDNYAWLLQQNFELSTEVGCDLMCSIAISFKILPCALDHRYVFLKNEVIKAERRILKELGFCVHVKHPHKLIYVFLKALNTLDNLSVLQKAWNFMNDSLRSDVFLRYAPETIACACVYMAARAYSIPMPLEKPWWRLFNASDREIYDICFRILGLYRQKYMDWAEAEEILDRLRQLREMKLANVANVVDATVVDELKLKQTVDQEAAVDNFESKKIVKSTARRRRNTGEEEKYSSYSRRNGHGEKGEKSKSRRVHHRSRSHHSGSRSRSRSRHRRRHRSRHRRHRHWDAGFREKLSPRFLTGC
ncbi:Cyclin-L2 [Trichinella spiralis]|uniref:Cyclin-L2 n=1 Tax=Trichinella spiralis TaxID=6334 RepID=A0A0V1AR10_TRISP|nr:Cyclin-L2 [Trichinella spiralis]